MTDLDDRLARVTVGGCASAEGGTKAEALLAALCTDWSRFFDEPQPPAVLEWLKSKQEAEAKESATL